MRLGRRSVSRLFWVFAALGISLAVKTRPAIAQAVPWWDPNYSSARQVTLTSGTQAIPSGTVTSVTLDHAALVAAGASLASGNDVRLIYRSGGVNTEISRTLASGSAWNAATTKLMFKTQALIPASSSDGNYFLYYGNSTPGALPAVTVPSARYFKAEQLVEQSTASTAFVDVPGTSLTFTPGQASETWLIFATGVLRSSSTKEITSEMHLLLNGAEVDYWAQKNNDASTPNGSGFLVFHRITGTTATQTVNLQYRGTTGTAFATSLRVVAVLLPQNANFQFADAPAAVTLPKNTVNANLLGLTFTPSAAGDYYVFGKVSQQDPAAGTAQSWLQDEAGGLHPDAPSGAHYSNPGNAWAEAAVAFRRTLTTASSTFSLRGTTGGNNGSSWQYARIMAFRADAWESSEYSESLPLSSSSGTGFTLKNSLTTAAPPAPRDYLVVQIERLSGTNDTALQKTGSLLDGGTTLLRTDRHINADTGALTGSHHVTAVANVKTTGSSVTYQNGFESSIAADTVDCAESTITALRFLDPTVTQRPVVRDLNSTTANGLYKIGAGLSIQVRFSEAVTVTGTPTLTLETGAVDEVLSYSSGSGTNTLTFLYTVNTGDTSPDLDAVGTTAFALNGGAIQDSALLNADVTLPAPGTPGSLGANKALVIDGILPSAPGTPFGSTSPNMGAYTVTWGAATDTGGAGTGAVTYTVQRSLNGGAFSTIASGLSATSVSESGLAGGTYTYQVQATDLAGNVGPFSGISAGVVVDKTPPTVLSMVALNPTTTNLAAVSYSVTFSETVLGVTSGSFGLSTTGLAGFSVQSASGSGTTWTVNVTTGTGTGTLQLTIAASPGITDLAGNALSGPYPAADLYNIDRNFPIVSAITPGGPSPTNANSVSFNVVLSKAVTGVDSSDFSVVAGAGLSGVGTPVVSGSGTSYTVTVGTGTGSGTIQLNLVDDDSIIDTAGNPLGGVGAGNGNFTGPTYTIDKQAPTVVSIAPADTNPTAAATVHFTVTFSESVSSVAIGSFSLAPTGVSGASITNVGGSGASYTVTVTTGTGSGSLGLNLVDNDSITDSAGNPLGGPGAGNGNFTGLTYTIDRLPPTVNSIVPADANPTAAATVHFTVTFSESVSGVAAGSFSLAPAGVTGASITNVAGSGASYTVTVGTGSGSGTLGLNLVDNDSITDGVGNPLGGPGAGNGNFTGQTYTIDRSFPVVQSINRAVASPTAAASVTFTVTFDRNVTGVDGTDFALVPSGLTGASITNVSGSGSSYTVTVGTGSGDGTLQLNLVDDDSIQDTLGNRLGGTGAGNGNFAGQVYTIDKTPPTVLSINRVGTTPTNATSVAFSVTFSESVTGVDAGDFSLVTTGVVGASIGTVSGPGATWTVSVNTGTGDGTIQLAMAGSPTITDTAGNNVIGPFPTGQIFTIDKTPPIIQSISAPSPTSTTTGPVSYTVTYSGADTVTLSNATVTLVTTGTASGSVSVTGSGTATRTVTLTGITGTGTLAISIAAGTASDLAGNLAAAAGPSATVSVDNSAKIDLPTLLQVESLTNPTSVTRSPAFSAQHNWSGPSPLDAVAFRIQVTTDPSFTALTHWNSPAGTLFPGSVTVPAGTRSPLIRYGTGGDVLPPLKLLSWGQQYFWRIQFQDSAADVSGFSTEPASFVMTTPAGDSSANGNGDPSALSWRYVGFPIAVGTQIPATVLLNQISYALRWDEPSRQWIQLTATDMLDGGRGYIAWAGPGVILSVTQGAVAVGNQPMKLTYTSLGAPTGVEVTEGRATNYYAGAQFLSNPFNAPISWDDPPAGLVEKPNLSSTYFKWDGTQYLTYNSVSKSGGAGPTIAPFQAFGVNVLASAPGDDVVFDEPAASAFPPSALTALAASPLPDPNAWALHLVATSGTALDTENYVGINPAADDAWDRRDAEEPGHGAATWVLLYFDHTDWTVRPHWYTHDFRQTRYKAGDEIVWVATVDGNTGAPVTLTWPNIGLMPTADWQYFIEDPVAGTSVDMTTTSSIQIGPLAGPATINIRAKRLTTSPGTLGISTVPAGPTPSSVTAGTAGVAMLALDVTAGGEAITVGQWTILNSGTGDGSKVKVSLYNGLAKIAGPVAFSGGVAVLSGLGQTVGDGVHQTWTVVYDFGADSSGTYRAEVDAEDIQGVGNSSGKPISPSSGTFQSSEVTVVAGASPAGTAAPGKKKGGCGLIGVEFLVIMAMIRESRRRGGSKRAGR